MKAFTPTMPRRLLFLYLTVSVACLVNAFLPLGHTTLSKKSAEFVVTRRRTSSSVDTWRLFLDPRWEQEIEENSRRRASRQGPGIGETAAGAILGGLLLGPFGALFGASVGSSVGRQNALSRSRKEEMEKLGVTQDMLDMANEIGLALERSMEGLKATQESLETHQRLARRYDADATELYDRAKAAIERNDEETARKLLLQRYEVQDKLKKMLLQCSDEKKRLETMERNVNTLETRAMEVDALLRRTVGAKAVKDSGDLGLSLDTEDPLLQKFRDMGIE